MKNANNNTIDIISESDPSNASADKKKKIIDVPNTLYEFILSIYQGNKLNKEYKKIFERYIDNVSDEQRISILNLAEERDTDYRITLSLAEFAIEGNANSRNRQILLSCIEYVISNVASLKEIGTNTIFQAWLDKSEGILDKLSFFSDRIVKITYFDDKGTEKKLSEKQKNNILCISAIWLYSKQASDFNSLLRYLSKTAFDIKGEKGAHVEAAAFSFAASMITSTKKAMFAYFLSKVSKQEEALSNVISQNNKKISTLNEKISSVQNNNNELMNSLNEALSNVIMLENEVKKLKEEIALMEEQAKHESIHINDAHMDERAKVYRLLDKDLRELINNAKTANSRTPAKTSVVEYQLDDALDIIERSLLWLK